MSIVKMFILPKAICIDSVQSSLKSQCILHKNRKSNPKTCIKPQRPWRVTAILRRKNKAGCIALTDFKLYYKTITIKQHGTGVITLKSMKQNREPRNKTTHIRSTNIWQRSQEDSMSRSSCCGSVVNKSEDRTLLNSFHNLTLLWYQSQIRTL